MLVVICPGIHPPDLTESFLRSLPDRLDILVFPANQPAYSGLHVLQFCWQQRGHQALNHPVLWIGFSAGVVGAATAACLWHYLGGKVLALIAIDGWGVPLFLPFPLHRISHDRFTHWSSALLGAGTSSFFADPPVAHLDLWRSPQYTSGWAVTPTAAIPMTAADFLNHRLQDYVNSNQEYTE